MIFKKRALFYLNTEVKVIETSEKHNLSVKEILTKFNIRKTQAYNILTAKYDVVNAIMKHLDTCSL
jgi:hypothetical protein